MRIVLGLVVALFLSVPVSAQTYLTSTTNSAALNASQTVFTLASGSGVAVGGGLYINREYMSVRAISGAVVTVLRGQAGTIATAHGISQTVVIIPAAAVASVVSGNDPSQTNGVGACTATAHRYLPIINVTAGNLWLCIASTWRGTNQTPLTYNSLVLDPR